MTVFPSTTSEKTKEIGSEKTKETVISITDSDSESRGIRETLVDYTESSDETSENCQIDVVHDCNTDCPNVKDPMISGKLPTDAQPSSDYEEQHQILGKSEEKITSEELFSSDDENCRGNIKCMG